MSSSTESHCNHYGMIETALLTLRMTLRSRRPAYHFDQGTPGVGIQKFSVEADFFDLQNGFFFFDEHYNYLFFVFEKVLDHEANNAELPTRPVSHFLRSPAH